jgi:hypothetical protein
LPKSKRQLEDVATQGKYMREILVIGMQMLIIAVFVTLFAFYGFVFWHWRNDTRRHDLLRESYRGPVTRRKTILYRTREISGEEDPWITES